MQVIEQFQRMAVDVINYMRKQIQSLKSDQMERYFIFLNGKIIYKKMLITHQIYKSNAVPVRIPVGV